MNLNINTLQAQLFGVVGWRQNYDTNDFVISNNLIASSTGKYYQDEHPLLTLDNIKQMCPDFNQITYSAWNPATNYNTLGTKVTRLSLNYRSLLAVGNTNKAPESEPLYWEEFTAFDEWLENKTKAAITKTIEKIYIEKNLAKQFRGLMENKALFDGAGRMNDTITNSNKLVGFEFIPTRGRGVTVKLHKVAYQGNTNETFDLFLYHSSQKDEIATIEIVYTGNGSVQWFDLNFELPYDTYFGGSFYLVYSQSQLTGLAINSGRDFSQELCSGCKGRYQLERTMSQYMDIHPFSVDDDSEMWDVTNNVYDYSKNYGLNVQLSIYCDPTGFIVQNKKDFADVISKGVANEILRYFVFNASARINRNEQLVNKETLLYELDGDPQGRRAGLKASWDDSIKSLMLELNGLDKVCQPCYSKGVNYRAI